MKFLCLFLCLSGCLFFSTSHAQETLSFAGRQWRIRGYDGMPGPNQFSTKNAWVDANGALHLRIRHEGGKWTCAEVIAEGDFHFGTYEFFIEGPVDTLDPQVVLGLFTYPRPETGKSGTHEIDIEFARWGNPAYPNLNYTVWPAKEALKSASSSTEIEFGSSRTIHRFHWTAEKIEFSSFAVKDKAAKVANWKFAPPDAAERISQVPQQLMLNLWLVDGKPPADGQEVEIAIHRFNFKPQEKGVSTFFHATPPSWD